MFRTEAAAEESLAAMGARRRLGIAMAAMTRMIATTISSSMSENPFCFCIRTCFFPKLSLCRLRRSVHRRHAPFQNGGLHTSVMRDASSMFSGQCASGGYHESRIRRRNSGFPGGADKFCHSPNPYAALGHSELLILAVVEFARK